MKSAVFLDRDGVLNAVHMDGDVAASPRRLDEFKLIDGATESVERLRRAGLVVVVVTNQPDVSRGRMDASELDAMHDLLRTSVPVDRIEVCPHSGEDGCDCRKPAPGMIHRAASVLGIDLGSSWTVGDRWVDVAAGRSAGTRTILIDRPYSFRPNSSAGPPSGLVADYSCADLRAAVTIVMEQMPS